MTLVRTGELPTNGLKRPYRYLTNQACVYRKLYYLVFSARRNASRSTREFWDHARACV